jgi:predicted  nucleic acid-binding Zn-ribbon protein
MKVIDATLDSLVRALKDAQEKKAKASNEWNAAQKAHLAAVQQLAHARHQLSEALKKLTGSEI